MQVRLPALSSALLLGFALPAFSQGDVFDVDVSTPGGTRVMGALKGIFTASPGGTIQGTAFGGNAVEGPVVEVAVDPNDPKLWLGAVAVPSKVTIARLVEGSNNFSTIAVGASGTPTDLEFSPFEADVVLVSQVGTAGNETGVYISEDGGWSWAAVPSTDGRDISEIAHSVNLPGGVLAMTASGERMVSFDGGRTFGAPTPQLPARPISMTNSIHTPLLWFATTDDKSVWRSTDGAVTWDLLPALGSSIHEHPNVPDMVWIATSNGRLQFSANRGDDWSTPEQVAPFDSFDRILDVDFDPAAGSVVLSGMTDKYAETTSAVVALGTATQGSGGLRPRHYFGGVVQPGNADFTFRGDRCVGDSIAVYIVSRDEGALPLFGGTLHVGGTIVTDFITKVPAPAGQAGTPGAGSFEVKAPLPSNPAIVGVKFVTQYAVIDPGAFDPSTVVLSSALRAIGQP